MVRKYLMLILLALAVVILSVVGYLNLKTEPNAASPFMAMPESTPAVLVINNFPRTCENLVMKNLMWQELSLDEDIRDFGRELMVLDSLLKHDDWSKEIADELKWYISFHPSGKGFDHTFVIPMENEKFSDFAKWFQNLSLSQSLYGIYEGVEIQQNIFKDSLYRDVYYSTNRGLFIASFKPNLVEDALRSIQEDKSLNNIKSFKSIESTSGSFADWNFYLNYQDIGSMQLLGIDVDEMSKSDIVWSDWTALDATVHPDLFLLNGFSNAPEKSYLRLFDKQKSQDIDAIEIIPEDVALFFHFGVSNYALYSKSKKEYFKNIGLEKEYNDKVEELKKENQFDIESEFEQWVSNEFGVMYLSQDGFEPADSKVAYFRLSDIRRTTGVLENLSNNSTDEFPSFGVANLLDGFESDIFGGIDEPHYLIIDKYLLLSKHMSLLKRVKEQYLSAQTLKKSELYSNFSGSLSDQSNVYLYIHVEKGKEIYDDLLHQNTLSFIEENPGFLEKFEQIGIQFKDGKKNMFYQNVAMNFNPKKRSQGKTLWEVGLDTSIVSKPAIVYNHYTNAREILVQDIQNTIYLIDNRGNIIWKRQMKERIHGPVYQIDVYKNNKLQMLFAGESSIYLLDRKGRDVENFPVQLPAVATSELKVIDYEKNREYRILIGIRGGEMLNYDRFGKKIKGWNFKASDEISYPINYFLLNGKDYIVAVGEEGRPYILNRRGDERLKINENLPPYHNRNYILELSNDLNQCKLITTDENGNFIKLKFNGEKENVNLDLISDQHQFLYEDINNDRKNDYVLLDSNKLMVYGHNKEKMFEIELEGSHPAFLNMYRFDSGYGKIGFTDTETAQLFLYRDAGGLDSNFPLKGNTAFTITDINKDGRQNVLVGLGNKLLVYNLK